MDPIIIDDITTTNIMDNDITRELENEFTAKEEIVLKKQTKTPQKKNPSKPVKKEKAPSIELNYENHCKHNPVMTSYKLQELKVACKNYKLNISGTKPLLISRLETHFKKMKHISNSEGLSRMDCSKVIYIKRSCHKR